MRLHSRFLRFALTSAVAAAMGLISSGWRLTPAAAEDWPQYRGPNRDGISTEKGWLTHWGPEGPKLLWRAAVGTGFSSISVSKGRAYTMGNTADKDTLYCLEAQSGKVVWQYSYPSVNRPNNYEGGPNATPTIDEDRAYTFSRNGDLVCFDLDTGKPVWFKDARNDFGAGPPTWGYACSPLVLGDLVIVEFGGKGASVVALNKTTGALVWRSGNDPVAYSSPVPFKYGNQTYIACFNGSGLVIVSADKGQEACRHPWKTSYDVNAATPIIVGDRVFLSSGYDRGCTLLQLGKAAPTVVWENKNMRNHYSSCVLLDGYLYGFDDAQLRCLDLKTGEVKWTRGGFGKGSLMAADGRLIVLGERGELAIVEATQVGYVQLARAQILGGKCWTMPVLSGGRIYARNATGDLVCVDVKGQ